MVIKGDSRQQCLSTDSGVRHSKLESCLCNLLTLWHCISYLTYLFLHLKNKDDNDDNCDNDYDGYDDDGDVDDDKTHLTSLLRGLREQIYVKCLKECLTHIY